MKKLIKRFRQSSKWTVYPPTGYPSLSIYPHAPDVSLPNEIHQFYEYCGGLASIIRTDDDVEVQVASPDRFSWTAATILGEHLDRQIAIIEKNIAWYWYVIGYTGTDEYFVIDLSSERFGRCCYTDFYSFGQKGSAPILATSYREFLERIYKAVAMGEVGFWQNERLGDAYD